MFVNALISMPQSFIAFAQYKAFIIFAVKSDKYKANFQKVA